MEGYFIGIDCGTQGTKAILVDAGTGRIVASSYRPHGIISDTRGKREQDPLEWVDALRQVVPEVLRRSGVERGKVLGLGVSGQQHGFVPIDEQGRVIRPAKLWCDTSTQVQCDTLIESLGGIGKVIELTGNGIPPGFTASKILWMREEEPDSYARLHTVLLPHDYLNFYLTGERKMEFGDASGTAIFNVRDRRWAKKVIHAIDPSGSLKAKLPSFMKPSAVCGRLRTEVAAEFGLSTNVIVSAGGGDNMMAAIGTGNVRPGIVTASLGTSGTIYAYSDSPVIDPKGELAAFCDSTGGWLPLVCTMNVTVATELVKDCLDLSNEDLDEKAAQVPPGSEGLVLLPYFQGERTPNLPRGTGVLYGLNPLNFRKGHLARAAMEGATFGLRYGLDVLRRCGIEPDQIRLTGGGSKSPLWRQIVADIFDCEVLVLPMEESAALGAAIQAIWAHQSLSATTSIADIASRFVERERGEILAPDGKRARRYASLYRMYLELGRSMEPIFERRSWGDVSSSS